MTVLSGFFDQFWKDGESFFDQIFSQGRGQVEASLSGALLTGTLQTDFKDIWAMITQEIPVDTIADLIVKVGDLTLKVSII